MSVIRRVANVLSGRDLREAARCGEEKKVRRLVESGLDVDSQDRHGKTPLYLASEQGHEEVVRVLLEWGAAVNAKSNTGQTALHNACNNGHVVVGWILLKSGANANAADKHGKTPLHFASEQSHEAAAMVLLQWGATVTAAQKNGWTPLHVVSWNGSEDFTRLLLESGAKTNAKSKRGETPLMLAKRKRHSKLIPLLEDAEKEQNVEANIKTRAASVAEIHCCPECDKTGSPSFGEEEIAEALEAKAKLKILASLCEQENSSIAELQKQIAGLRNEMKEKSLNEKLPRTRRLSGIEKCCKQELAAELTLDELKQDGHISTNELFWAQKVNTQDDAPNLAVSNMKSLRRGQSVTKKQKDGLLSNRTKQSLRLDSLVVFQAAPLVWVDRNGNRYPLVSPDFETEKKDIKEAVDEARILGYGEVDIVFEEATTKRLAAFLATARSPVLHFSCHGHPEYLCMENRGALQPLLVEEMKEFVSAGTGCLKLVFVSACHSRHVGDAFIASGVEHVVCCKTEASVRDTAAIVFAQSFYTALACGNCLKASFELARQAVLVSPSVHDSRVEMNKFLLLPEKPDGDSYHNVPIFYTSPVLQVAPAEKGQCSQRHIPPTPELHFGRELSIYKVVEKLENARCIKIEGPHGIGKSSVAKAVVNYVLKRSRTFSFNEFFWVPSVHNWQDDVSVELGNIVEMCKNDGIDLAREQASRDFKESSRKIVTWLYKTRALIVFDARKLDSDAGLRKLDVFLNELLLETCYAKVLVVCPPGQDVCETTSYLAARVILPPLDMESSALLFGNLCRFVQQQFFSGLSSSKELTDLLVPDITWDVVPMEQMSGLSSDIFALVGAGNPSSIREAALNITEEKYSELVYKGLLHLEEILSLVSGQLENVPSTEDPDICNMRYTLRKLEQLCDKLPSTAKLKENCGK